MRTSKSRNRCVAKISCVKKLAYDQLLTFKPEDLQGRDYLKVLFLRKTGPPSFTSLFNTKKVHQIIQKLFSKSAVSPRLLVTNINIQQYGKFPQ